MSDQNKINLIRENWAQASEKLGFMFVSPYSVIIDGKLESIFAFLPEYGSVNGTLIGLISRTSRNLFERADELKCYVSYLNTEAYVEFDLDQIRETLMDWGYFGEPDKKPLWLGPSP